ncbi:hypothetical protein Desca_2589 [Desulfotomaculum nigrificans CO-1-SRB]|uniref:Uncharacterized protein n=1 Tax=Desulfotomaculum nigrificans (strain DSM 14880 / VKM B-2319 / CO-1-SRB) TaxID=868595 RepID=F6B5H9_DESCC|nr:hypothetical protein [Desulfotomaculum nigrificans]AEF95411.1 hypothetical protein Desca_2589 [Desulfotomaculum nigrificans CO-1-SRB]
MKWQEVRKLYPDQYVLIKILESHIENGAEIVDEVAIVRSISDPKEATFELVRSKGDTLVYHTSNEQLSIAIRVGPGFRGVV